MAVTQNNSNNPYRPQRQHHDDAGCDLRTTHAVGVEPFAVRIAPTGYCAMAGDIPPHSVGLVFARSSLHRQGLSLANGVGVIDSGYRGEVLIPLRNDTDMPVVVGRDERVAQIVVVPLDLSSVLYAHTSNTNNQSRDTGGFGSTGRI